MIPVALSPDVLLGQSCLSDILPRMGSHLGKHLRQSILPVSLRYWPLDLYRAQISLKIMSQMLVSVPKAAGTACE